MIQMGGAVARVPEDATSVGGRSSAFQLLCIGIWEEPADRALCLWTSHDLHPEDVDFRVEVM
jgi:hypothetical protein